MTHRLGTSALFALLCVWQTTLPTFAQTRATTIECAPCGLSGQQPAAATFDESRLTFVSTIKPAVFEGRTVRMDVIARVVQVSPLIVEQLDVRTRPVGGTLRPLDGKDDDDGSCDLTRVEAVDRASKPIVSSLRFNDVISGQIVMQQNEERPENVLAAKPVLTTVRRISGPVPYFHTPALKGCANRSGRVFEYRGPANDAVTVFTDGRIVYRDAQFRRFEQERLTDGELADVMRAFASANFDAWPTDVGPPEYGPRPGITLVAARYQDVWLAGKEERLAPLVARMKALAAHATSHSYFLLKARSRQPLTILPWPYPRVSLAGFSAFRERALMRRQSSVGDPVPGAQALEERLPETFVSRVPVNIPTEDTSNDANKYVYFSEGGTLYRVRFTPRCAPPDSFYCGTFYALDVDPIPDIEIELLPQAERTYRLMRAQGIFSGGDSQGEQLDLAMITQLHLVAVNRVNTYLWTSGMGLRLADLPPSGATIERDEYERHKPIYVAIMKYLETGLDLIENGVVFEHVRVCQIEPGVVETCNVK